MSYYDLIMKTNKVIVVEPYKPEMMGFYTTVFNKSGDQLVGNNRAVGLCDINMTPQEFNQHIDTMIQEHFQIRIYG